MRHPYRNCMLLSSAEQGPLADRPGAALLEPDLYNRLPTGEPLSGKP
jgi:hypothetical protein